MAELAVRRSCSDLQSYADLASVYGVSCIQRIAYTITPCQRYPVESREDPSEYVVGYTE